MVEPLFAFLTIYFSCCAATADDSKKAIILGMIAVFCAHVFWIRLLGTTIRIVDGE